MVRASTRAKKGKSLGKSKGMGKFKLKEKEQKIRKIQKSAKKKMPKARLKDDYVKRAKNRLKAMKKGTDNDIGEGKQAQNKGDIRTMMQLG